MTARKLEQEIDRLYGLPLAEFIGERNALAKRLRGGGDRAAADEVKALAKPPVTAWAVNALYHHERDRFDALLEAAAAVRAALAGEGDRRQAEAEKRKALKALVGRAAKILAKAGNAATPANRQRISHTLETLAARQPGDDEPRLGRLTTDLEPRGFDVLAGLAASLAPAAPSRSTAKARAGKKRAAKAAPVKAAPAKPVAASKPDQRLVKARRQVDEHQAALTEAQRLAEAAEADAAEARERHERLIEEAAEAERLARAASKALARAKTELAAANKAATQAGTARRSARSRLATARRKLERLES